ncbi:MAG: NifB/NifX family molybdenum-iron cluster-binding protein [Acidobacteriota bacterium]
MRIAVASQDGESISAHFGRCASFIIFDAEDGTVLRKELRQNTHASHGVGNCHVAGHGDQPHSHAALVQVLHDCQAALCYGMGCRAADDLRQNGIQPVIVDRKRSPEEAVALYVEGKLPAANREFCAGHHPHQH